MLIRSLRSARLPIPRIAAALMLVLATVAPAVAQPSAPPQPEPAQPEPAAQSVRIGRAGLAAGETVTETRKVASSVTFNVTLNGEVVQVLTQQTQEDRVVATAVQERTDDRPTAVRIAFISHTRVSKQNDVETTASDPTTGKTYRAVADGDNVTVTYADGAETEPTGPETAAVTAAFRTMTTGSHFAAALPDEAIAVGAEVELDRAELAKGFDLGDGAAGKVTAATMTLKVVRELDGRRVAVFGASIRSEISPSPMITVAIEQTGEIVFDVASGVVLKTELSGPITVTGGQQRPEGNMEVKGEGKTSLTTSAKIESADTEDGGD